MPCFAVAFHTSSHTWITPRTANLLLGSSNICSRHMLQQEIFKVLRLSSRNTGVFQVDVSWIDKWIIPILSLCPLQLYCNHWSRDTSEQNSQSKLYLLKSMLNSTTTVRFGLNGISLLSSSSL